MANSLLTSDIVLNELLRRFQNNCSFSRTINRQYDDQFAKENGTIGKIGTALRVRKPVRYTVQTGSTALSTQATSEQYVYVTVTQRAHVDFTFSSQELALDVMDFADRYLEGAAVALSSQVDGDGLALALNVANSVGVPGTSPGDGAPTTDPVLDASGKGTILKAGALMDIFTTPVNQRSLVLSPYAQATTVNSLTNLFNPQTTISEQFIKGQMGSAMNFDFLMDQNVNKLTTGSRAATGAVVSGYDAVGGTTVSLTTAGATDTFVVGDVFTIAGVNSVNPVTKVDNGRLQQFTVTAPATAVGSAVTLSVYPLILPPATPSNPLQTVTAAPVNGHAVVFMGAPSTAYSQNLAFQKDAFTLVTADLIMPKGIHFASRKSLDNISMRIVQQYQISDDTLPCRVDVLYGWTTLIPEFACRVWGN